MRKILVCGLVVMGVVGRGLGQAAVVPSAADKMKFNAVDSTQTINYFNARVMPENAYRVLFIGDSLMFHTHDEPGWMYDSGMAATAPAKDYVHLVTAHIQGKFRTRPVEMLVDNGGMGRLGRCLSI